MKKTPKRISLVAASAAVAVALAIGPAAAAGAAQKDFSYNCSGYSALSLSSKALHTVGHYRNWSLVASWNNGTVAAWRTSYLNPAAGVASIYGSYAIYDWSVYCIQYA